MTKGRIREGEKARDRQSEGKREIQRKMQREMKLEAEGRMLSGRKCTPSV